MSKTRPSEVSNEKIIEVLTELREASQNVIKLTKKRLRLIRSEMQKRGLIASKLEKLRAADGGSFVQGEPNCFKQPSIYAKASNHESAYFCGDCGWVKGSPDFDSSLEDIKCTICGNIVEHHQRSVMD
jgi:hypothetical protein